MHAVAIATPAATHFPLAVAALRRRQARPRREAADVVAGRRRRSWCRRPRTAVSSSCATTPTATPRPCQELRRLVHAGDLGDIQFVDSVRINLGLVQPDVDVLWDLAPHDLSILDFLLPPGAGVGRRRRPRRRPHRARHGLRRLPDAAAGQRGHRPRPRQLAEPDQDPHHGHRRLAAHGGVGRPQPQPAAVASTTGASTGRPRRSSTRTTASRCGSPTGSGDMVAPALREQEALRVMMARVRRRDPRAPRRRAPTAGPACACMTVLEAAARSLALDGAFVRRRGVASMIENSVVPGDRAAPAPSGPPSSTSSSPRERREIARPGQLRPGPAREPRRRPGRPDGSRLVEGDIRDRRRSCAR